MSPSISVTRIVEQVCCNGLAHRDGHGEPQAARPSGKSERGRKGQLHRKHRSGGRPEPRSK